MKPSYYYKYHYKASFINTGNPEHLLNADLQYGFLEIVFPRGSDGMPISEAVSERAVLRRLGLKKRNKGFTLRVDKPDPHDNAVVTLLRREAYSKEWCAIARLTRVSLWLN